MSHYSVAQREKAVKGQSKTTVLNGGVRTSQSLLVPLCKFWDTGKTRREV